MDVKRIIVKQLKKKGSVRSKDIVRATGFSRVYVNRFFQKLVNSGEIMLVGKANVARYVSARNQGSGWKKDILRIRKTLANKGLSEDAALDDIKTATGIFLKLPLNTASVLEYAFTEILNNAIEHSRSRTIFVEMERDKHAVYFEVLDRGIGIFKNIMKERRLKSELEAIQDLLKGKQTTSPTDFSHLS